MAQDPQSAITVMIDERSGVERSLKKFKRMCESFGVVREYRKRQEYKNLLLRIKKNRSSRKTQKENCDEIYESFKVLISKYKKASNEAFFISF